MKKLKVKEFVTKHKDEIIGFALGAGVAAIGVAVGYKIAYEEFADLPFVKDENIAKVLTDADCKSVVFTGIREVNSGLKVDDMGELGEAIKECCGEKCEFTHFIAIGEKLKTEA